MKFTGSLLLAAAPVALGLGPQGYNIPSNLQDGLYGVVLDSQGNPQGGPQLINGGDNHAQDSPWNPSDQHNDNNHGQWTNQPQQNNQPWQNNQPQQNNQPWQNNQPQQNNQPWQNNHPQQNNQPWQNNQPGQHNQPWQNGQPGQNGQPAQNGWPFQNGWPWQNNGQPKKDQSKKSWPRTFGAFAGRPGITKRDSFPGTVDLGCSGRDLQGAGEINAWNSLAGWCGDGGHTSQYSIYFSKSQGTVWYSCSKIGPQPCNGKELTDARERFQHGCSNLKSGHIYVQNWKKTYGRAAPGDNICGSS